ncbi:unnamed protein product, partial [Oppiella nova]
YRRSEPAQVGLQGKDNEKLAAWCAGPIGRSVMDRFLLQSLPQLLSPKGSLYLMTLAINKTEEIREMMAEIGFEVTVVLESIRERPPFPEHIKALRIRRPVIIY